MNKKTKSLLAAACLAFGASVSAAADSNATARWQRAIDEAAARGGGRVVVPAGRHLVGELELRNNVELHLEKGAVLEGVPGLENYRARRLPFSEGTWSAVVSGYAVTNVAITGEGEIFGNGRVWNPANDAVDAMGCTEGLRPRGLFFGDSKNVRLESFFLRDAACWGIVFKRCADVTARGVRIDSCVNVNNDGFDIEAKNVLIENCDINCGDDALCLKSNDPNFVVEDVTVRDCVARTHCSAIKFGTASHGTMRNIRFERIRIEAPRRVYRDLAPMPKDLLNPPRVKCAPAYLSGPGIGAICIECVDGGIVEDVTIDGVELSGFKVPLFIRGGRRLSRTCGIPPNDKYVLRNILVENVRGRAESRIPSSISGVPGCRPENVTLRNVAIECVGDGDAPIRVPGSELDGVYPEATMFAHPYHLPVYGLYIDRPESVKLENVNFTLRKGTTDSRPALSASSAGGRTVAPDTVDWLEKQDLHEFCLLNEPDFGIRAARAGKNVEGTALKINGTTYEHGIGLHAFPDKVQIGDFFPGGRGKRFSVTFGLDDRSGDSASAILNLYADGKLVATSGTVRKGEPAKEMSVDLRGVLVLSIELKEGGTRSYRALADLADAAFAMETGAKLLDSPSSFTRQLGILTPPDDGKPRVNGPALYGVRPKKQLLYRVPVSGDLPLEITVDGLPEGTFFDPETRQLKGVTPARKGDHRLVIRAKNAKGETRRDFTLRVGDQIGLTPPMGWNSWNACGPSVSDQTVRRMADAALKFRLVDHGWQYLVIDDGWQRSERHQDNPVFAGPRRDEKGNILPNAKFPDMKALADYVHSKGLKFGIYSSPGKTTCFGAEGSWMNEWRDARQFVAWGVDYLKHDCCGYDSQRFSEGRHHRLIPWMMMGKALQEGDRDIFYSISGGGLVDLFPRCRANSQRITGDCFNSWPHVRRSMTAESYYWMNTEPGHWCDPDMLVLQASGPKRGHRLTPNEFYTHFSMWCLFSAPLMMGYGLDRTTPETLSMLTNDEVLDVNQDALGLCAAPVQTPGRDQVWAKPMADGSIAVGLVNMAYTEHAVKFCFKKAGMRGKWRVRDLWRQRDEGVFENCYEVSVPGHATQLVRIWPTAGAKFDDDVLDIRDFAWMRVTEEERPVRPGADGCKGCEERRTAARSSFEADSDAMTASLAEPKEEKAEKPAK